jgi:RNA polymerase sigma-70 factor, ECF subfamily
MDVAELERIRRARGGEPEAFRLIVEAYSQPLWRAAFRILGDPGVAEDAVQETFLRAWRALDRFDEKAEFSTWLYRIAINAAIDKRRERKRREPFSAALPEDVDGRVTARSTAADPQRSALWRDLVEHAREAIAGLPETERTAILLRHFEGCSITEIATALGAKESAAKQAVFRAVQKLRTVLGPLMKERRNESA